jgi:biotin carboxyl carrier protein
MNKNFNVKVNEASEFELNTSDINNLDILQLSSSKFHVLQNNKSIKIILEKSDFFSRKYNLSINSNNYTVTISNEIDTLIKNLGFSLGTTKKANDIKAPMPGLILNINVKEGQEVKEGDPLLILEAMKMENTIEAHKDGFIKTIKVKSGETVDKGELMIEMA